MPGGWFGEYLRDPTGTLARLGEAALSWAPLLGPVLAGLLAVLCTGRWWWRRQRHARLAIGARLVTVRVPPLVDPAGAAVLWSHLMGLLRPAWWRWLGGQPHLVWEYVVGDQGVSIRVWVPGPVPPGLVERAIEAAWPGAHTHTSHTPDPPLPTPQPGRAWQIAAGELRLARPEALPIRAGFDTDPLRALLAATAGLRPGEQACVQILARPVTGTRLATARRGARRLHQPRAATRLTSLLLDLITPGPLTPRRRAQPGAGLDPLSSLEQSATHRAILTKTRAGQYETRVRYAVATPLPAQPSAEQRAAAREITRGRAHTLAAVFATYTEHNHYTRHHLRHPDLTLAARRLGRGDLLSVPELAGLAHLPTDPDRPEIARAAARALPAPPGVARPGPDTKPLGDTDSAHPRPVALRIPDARHHLHVLGATGSGKSTLLAQLILADAHAGRGVVVIDPKGDLVTDVLDRLPRTAAGRLVLLDADSPARPPCLNPLDGGPTDRTVDNLLSVFRRVYAAFWGPRTDDVLRAACLTLRAGPGTASLADVPRLLAEPAYRARATAAVTDPVLRGFWTWYDELTDPARAQVIAPLMNKLRAFLLRPFVRDTLTAGPSTVDMDHILDGGIALVRIPKGSLGDETTRLIGSLVVARAWQATTARATMPEPQRRDASLVLDECHNFLHLPYPLDDMLAEARGYHVALTLSHQHLGQLTRELREAIATNARNKIYFTTSPDDARDLARHTAPHLTEHDLAHLGAYHAATRLILHGAHTTPFTLRTRPLPPAIPGRAHHLRTTTHHPRRQHNAPRPGPATAYGPRPTRPLPPQPDPGSDPRRAA